MADQSSPLKLVLDFGALLDFVIKPGWNGKRHSLDRRQQNINWLVCATQRGLVELHVPRFMAYSVHAQVCESYNSDQAAKALRYIRRHFEFESPSLELDLLDERIANIKHFPGSCDIEDAYLLVFAEAIGSYVILSKSALDLQALVKENSRNFLRFRIPIWDMEKCWDQLLDSLSNRPEIIKSLFSTKTICVLMKDREPIELPVGATPVDLAYTIHTELGDHCFRAIVNECEVPLDTPLQTGDWVAIIDSAQSYPQLQWLDTVVTRVARSNIRRWHDRSARTRGWQKLKERLTSAQLEDTFLHTLARQLSCRSKNELAQKLGYNTVSINEVILLLEHQKDLHRQQVNCSTQPRYTIHLAGCCQPLPDDPIMGFLRQSGQIHSVHHQCCSHLHESLKIRCETMHWTMNQCSIEITIKSNDRPGLLHDVLKKIEYVLSQHQESHQPEISTIVDVRQVEIYGNRRALLRLGLPLAEKETLIDILQGVRELKDVLSYRLNIPDDAVNITANLSESDDHHQRS